MSGREAWDRLYADQGRPWKGMADEVVPLAGTVLELGVGNGKGLSALASTASPVGLDISRPALLSCQGHFSIPLVQADVRQLPFKDRSFSGVSASHVLGHLTSAGREMAAREIVRVLRPNGLLYLNEFGEQDMRCGRGSEPEPRTFERGNGIICHHFIDGEFRELFPSLRLEREWERRVDKRYHGRAEVRQERRALLVR